MGHGVFYLGVGTVTCTTRVSGGSRNLLLGSWDCYVYNKGKWGGSRNILLGSWDCYVYNKGEWGGSRSLLLGSWDCYVYNKGEWWVTESFTWELGLLRVQQG